MTYIHQVATDTLDFNYCSILIEAILKIFFTIYWIKYVDEARKEIDGEEYNPITEVIANIWNYIFTQSERQATNAGEEYAQIP